MFSELLLEFNKIPKKKYKDESFISICGFPHYEKVASNLLAFFLDYTREHCLYDLFVKSLIETIGKNPDDYDLDFSVETEFYTNKGNYIDLLLKSETINIVIENKIFAWLYNDLDDYYTTASEKGKIPPLGIVLSLKPVTSIHKNFINITYEMFFNTVKKNLGYYVQAGNKKYLPLLIDFMDNIETLDWSRNMDKDFIDFMRNNEDEAISFAKKIDELRKDLRNIVKNVNQLTKEKIQNKTTKIWAYRDLPYLYDIAVVDYYPNPDKTITITLDSKIDLSEWEFSLWVRSNNSNTTIDIEDLGKRTGVPGKMKGERYYFDTKFGIEEEAEVISAFIAKVFNNI